MGGWVGGWVGVLSVCMCVHVMVCVCMYVYVCDGMCVCIHSHHIPRTIEVSHMMQAASSMFIQSISTSDNGSIGGNGLVCVSKRCVSKGCVESQGRVKSGLG